MRRRAWLSVSRLGSALLTLGLIVVVAYLLINLAPGDLADALAGEIGAASPEFMARVRAEYGLDLPAYERFFNYLRHVAVLDLGYSFRNGMPVADLIISRLPATLLLGLASIALALVLGTTIGVIAALNRGGWVDAALSAWATIGIATPLFWVGLMAIFLFSVELNWLPTGGIASVDASGVNPILDRLRHLIMPAATLSLFYLSIYARVARQEAIAALESEFVRTARAKGLGRARILVWHVLRNSLLPIIAITGVELGTLIGGTITVETVFSWPGMGRLAYEAVAGRDVNLLMGILLFSAALIIVTNLAIDLVYALVDPRVSA